MGAGRHIIEHEEIDLDAHIQEVARRVALPGPQGAQGPTGATGAIGATGAAGPNQVTTATDTDINALIKGNGSKILAAVPDTDYLTPNSHLLSLTAVISQTAHGFTAGKALTLPSGSSNYQLCDSSAGDSFAGFVQSVIDADTFVLVFAGYSGAIFSGLTSGTTYYTDPASPGALTATQPIGSGYTQSVLLARSTTAGTIQPATNIPFPLPTALLPVDTDGTLAANSDSKIATQKATKTYADTKVPATRTVNGHALSADVTVSKSDVGLGSVTNDAQLKAADLDTDGTLAANSDTKIPSQKAVKTYADQLIGAANATVYKGATDCSTNPNYPAADAGWLYRVSVAGKIGGASGIVVEAGDMFICLTDGTSAGTQAAVGSNWNVIQANIDGAVIGPASVTDANPVVFDGITGKLIKQITYSAFKTALALVKGDVGLGSVDNTADSAKSVLSATKLTTARNIDGQSFDGSADITVIAPGTHAATSKTTPVDADELPIVDSAASNVLKKLTFANLKAWIIAFITGYTKPVGYYYKLAIQDASSTTINLAFASMVFTDGSIVPFETLNGSYTIDSASSGAVNKLDKGVMVNGIWYHIYAIAKTDGTTGGLISPLINGVGSGATVSYTASGGVITAVTAAAPAGGSGYRVGDIVRVTSGDGTALVKVATVSGTAVATWATTAVYAGAASYSTATGQTTTTTPTLPTGYTIMRKVGSAYYTGGAFRPFTKYDKKFEYKPNVPANAGGDLPYQTTQTKVVIDDLVPMTATRCQFMTQLSTGAANDLYFQINNTSTGSNFISWAYCAAGKTRAYQIEIPIITPQTLWYLDATAGSSGSQRIYMKWWEDTID